MYYSVFIYVLERQSNKEKQVKKVRSSIIASPLKWPESQMWAQISQESPMLVATAQRHEPGS